MSTPIVGAQLLYTSWSYHFVCQSNSNLIMKWELWKYGSERNRMELAFQSWKI